MWADDGLGGEKAVLGKVKKKKKTKDKVNGYDTSVECPWNSCESSSQIDQYCKHLSI